LGHEPPVGDAPAGTIQIPGSIAVDDGGNAYAVWADRRNGHADIYFSYRPAGGAWSAGERVNDDAGAAEQWDPAIAVDGAGNIYVIWQDNRGGNYDIYSSCRLIGGSWGTNVMVNDDADEANQATPALAVHGDRLVAVWQDWRSGDADIYSSPGLSVGGWGANERVNDDAWAARQLDPAVAVDSSGVAYAVWSDERDGDADVYFGYRADGYGVFVPLVLRGW